MRAYVRQGPYMDLRCCDGADTDFFVNEKGTALGVKQCRIRRELLCVHEQYIKERKRSI